MAAEQAEARAEGRTTRADSALEETARNARAAVDRLEQMLEFVHLVRRAGRAAAHGPDDAER